MDFFECEWGLCEEKFFLLDFYDFREYFEGYLRGILLGYWWGFFDDIILDNFVCYWRDCGWDLFIDVGDLICYVFFYVFYIRIKFEGYKK